ncbi:MAG: hypothetical protein GX115_18210 [Ruminiclostridium sp.]|nr:hypothetical protein [Ruminiclostridium sp.]
MHGKGKIKIIPREELIIRESKKIPFGNGEIWFEQLDALSVHRDIVRDKFLKDMEILRKPSSPALVAVCLYETDMDDELSELIIRTLSNTGRKLLKVVFVGASRNLQKTMQQIILRFPVPFLIAFMDDYEKAKLWLIPSS